MGILSWFRKQQELVIKVEMNVNIKMPTKLTVKVVKNGSSGESFNYFDKKEKTFDFSDDNKVNKEIPDLGDVMELVKFGKNVE